jgi:hypothetical protein
MTRETMLSFNCAGGESRTGLKEILQSELAPDRDFLHSTVRR